MIIIPNVKVTRRWILQTIVWGRWPTIKVWTWPMKSSRPKHGRPLFYGLMLGIVEFRWFDNEWGN